MTKDDNKKSFTLRLNPDLSAKVEKESASLGLSQNAYITMVLHKALRSEKISQPVGYVKVVVNRSIPNDVKNMHYDDKNILRGCKYEGSSRGQALY